MWHWLRNEKLRKSCTLYVPIILSALLHSVLVTIYMMVSYSEQATLFLTLKKGVLADEPVHFVELHVPTATSHNDASAQIVHNVSSTQLQADVLQSNPQQLPPSNTKKQASCLHKTPEPQKKTSLTYKKEDNTAIQYNELHKKVMACWRAPRGIESDCSCELEAIIASNGSIQSIVTKKSSGILMFDIAARSALSSVEFPRWSRGKSIVIAFNN